MSNKIKQILKDVNTPWNPEMPLYYHAHPDLPFEEVTKWCETYGWIVHYTTRKSRKAYEKWLKTKVSN